MKAIITDLDRTLLHTDKSVSEHTIAVLKKCHDHGILIMAASARPLRDILIYNNLIGFDAITATNGAVISLPQNLLEVGISCESGEKILSAILQYPDAFLSIETSKGLYSNRDIPVWEPAIWDKFPTLPEDIILYKILASSQQKPLYEGIETTLTDEVYHTIANNDLIQIMSKEATKWNGIKQMLSHFGVSPSEAVYFGDDNDDRNGKWVDQILSQRREDGLWGNFHTLSRPVPGKNYTTEQAIRRLYYLGYTAEDEVIQRVLKRMEQCIKGELDIDNYSEKKHDWVFFEKLMLAAWLRIFEPQNETALEVAYQWAQIVEKAFAGGSYSIADDIAAFTEWKGRKPKSGFETGFGMFYHAALLPGVLSPKTEDLFLDYYLSKPDGMYYIYDKPLNQLSETFASRKSSCYIAAIEVLSRYDLAKEKLTFVMDWINANRNESGQWDFGEKAKDGVYFPLSDRWDKTTRITDSTYRISKLFGLPCYCGHDCSKCVTYIATQTNNDDLRRQAQSFYKESFGLDIPLENFYCHGGRSKNVFELCKECPFKKCCIERGIDSCSKCSEYPCKEISDYQEKYVNKCNQLRNELK